LCGNLVSVAFRHGVNGQGGMAKDFDMRAIGPRKLRTATFCGLVFGTLSDATPPIEDYLGEAIVARVRRVLKKPVEVIGRFVQPLPNNWKLYMENVKDTYHASLLHLFFATFRITRLSQGGGVLLSESGAHHASTTLAPAQSADTTYRDAGLRSDHESFRLADPALLEIRDEWGDGIHLQILSVFPGFVLQQIHNCLAVRQIVPRGVGAMDLHWTYLGFADDTPDMRALRLKQCNLVGPAGFVSMEDGCVGGFVQRATATAEDAESVVEMGGSAAETQTTRATEAAVRGFWKEWRGLMGI
jgi:anthranilate 1,2-dioxygenase large subunit/terephthalate 1,2-dioxygenase oxygenase component alpha subunit